ncbi:uncharacterized protein LOC132945365 [Metopolophium dirhodum]|uniref:uncharacterized protein LOC132945365 n=1 Tax=Metopolophium dirhodum TaxID=44670 RepID=UPI00298FA272|nr:uncharacterized protein LOC132945365 [Metopolophium dirhodum]
MYFQEKIIISDDDGEIRKIKKQSDFTPLREYDVYGEKIYLSKIDYGKDKIRNAIKSNNLSMQTPLTIQTAKRTWPDIARKYYNNQMATLNKKKKSEMFFTTKKWCEKKKAEAKAAEEKMAAKNV